MSKQKGDSIYHTIFTTTDKFEDYEGSLGDIEEILQRDDEKIIAKIKPRFTSVKR